MQVMWLPESWPWPIPALLRLLHRPVIRGSRLMLTLPAPEALGALTIRNERGEVLLRLADQLATRHKLFRLPMLPENENLTLQDSSGHVLYERIVHLKESAAPKATAPAVSATPVPPPSPIHTADAGSAPSVIETERQVNP